MTHKQTSSLIKRLLSPDAYRHTTGTIEVIETHVSWVFLTGDLAYKVKKPCHYGFLDFSTLEKRKHFCEEEVRLNKRFAPHLYQTVLPITGQPENAVVGGEGPPTDWAVQLKQFDRADQLDALFDRQALTASDCETLGSDIAHMQERLEAADKGSPWGNSATFLHTVDLNLHQLHQIRPDLRTMIGVLNEWFQARVTHHTDTFVQRRDNQKIRECHGDLHLANVLRDGQHFLAFDGIEFNDSLRWIDTASDIAFLAMDLESRGRRDFSSRVISSWIESSNDHSSLQLLPLYTAYRAVVRATVAAIRRRQLNHGDRDSSITETNDECEHYLNIALGSTAGHSPRCFATTGVSGSGKTTLAGRLIDTCGAVRLRSDIERKRLAGMAPTQRPRDEKTRRDLYSEAMNLRVYQRLAELASTVLNAGYDVVVDATYHERHHRAILAQMALEHNLPVTWLEIDIPAEFLLSRIAQRRAENADASDASIDIARQQLSTRQPITSEELSIHPHSRHLRLSPWDVETNEGIKNVL